MIQLHDISHYTSEMNKGIKEKLWFLDHLTFKPDLVVDYGCANGTVLENLSPLLPGVQLIGLDVSKEMLALAESKNIPNASYALVDPAALDWEPPSENNVLILSSVIHEVYSYCTGIGIVCFWEFVFSGKFKMIAIRDMMIDPSDISFSPDEVALIRAKADPVQLADFEEHWGSIDDRVACLHYLFKYRYVHNWQREVAEDYFPVTNTFFRVLKDLAKEKYETRAFCHYLFEWQRDHIKETFGVAISTPTHYNWLLLRKD